jgi:hypothetical protein
LGGGANQKKERDKAESQKKHSFWAFKINKMILKHINYNESQIGSLLFPEIKQKK